MREYSAGRVTMHGDSGVEKPTSFTVGVLHATYFFDVSASNPMEEYFREQSLASLAKSSAT